jgi:GH35 family endo-1,4-beta-xylanase
MRTIISRAESGEGQITAVFERAGQPYDKSLQQVCSAGKEWKEFSLPFEAHADFAAGAANLVLHCGHALQTIEVSDVRLVNHARAVKLTDLPRTRFSYAGREADAPWRKAPQERIEKIRKGDLAIRVVDAAGKPVANADVNVVMKRHAFPFGSAVAADMLLREGPDAQKYREYITRLFNRVVMENDLKWQGWEGNRKRAIEGVDWLLKQGVEVRGHNLIWPGWRFLPRDLQQLKNDPEKLRKRIKDHILDEATAMKGRLVEWDVINEPYTNKDVQAILGDAEMIEWFKLARQGDDKAVLFLNDYPILRGGSEGHVDHFEKTIKMLIDGGAPIGGIGVQCHYASSPPGIPQLIAGLDRFGKFNLPIAITELDINADDEQLQADFMRDHMIATFSHPAVDSIIMWGFWEGRHWAPKAALYARDWSVRPVGAAWENLVLKEWMTNVTVKTDARGVAKVRGFLGDYEISSGAVTEKARLGRDGASVRVVVK